MKNFGITQFVKSFLPNANITKSHDNNGLVEIKAEYHHFSLSVPTHGTIHLKPLSVPSHRHNQLNEYVLEVKSIAAMFSDIDALEEMVTEAIRTIEKEQVQINIKKELGLLSHLKANFTIIHDLNEATKIVDFLKMSATDRTFYFDVKKILHTNGTIDINDIHCVSWFNKRPYLAMSNHNVTQSEFKNCLVGRYIRGDIYTKAMAL